MVQAAWGLGAHLENYPQGLQALQLADACEDGGGHVPAHMQLLQHNMHEKATA
jgi:hypothetical protein